MNPAEVGATERAAAFPIVGVGASAGGLEALLQLLCALPVDTGLGFVMRGPLLVLDADLRVKTASASFYSGFQVAPIATEGRLLYELGNGQWNIPALRTLMEDILPKSQVVDDFEVRHTFEHLGLRIMRLNARRLDLRGEGERLVVLSIEDVTERVMAQEALRESEERSRLAMEATGVGIWEWNLSTNQIHWDTQMFRIYGVPPTPDGIVPYTTWSSAVLPEELAGQEAALQATVQSRRHNSREFRIRRAEDGECRHLQAVETVRLDAQGQAAYVVGTNLDVTLRQQKEAELNASEERSRLAREELAALMDALPAFVWTCFDADCRVITGNRAANELVQVPAGTNISQSAVASGEGVYLRQLKEDGTEYLPEELPMQRAIATGRPVLNAQLDFRFADGRRVLALGNVVPLFDEQGKPRGAVSAFLDITERKCLEEGLRQNEALFAALIEQAPGGVYVVDDQFRMMQINALARPVFAAAEPLIGRDLAEIQHILWGQELGPQLAEIFRHTLETGERYVSPRFTERRADLGEEKSYEWETQRITLPNGKHGLVCYFADVTERERSAAALRESESFNRSIVESSQDCIKVLDLEGRLISMSARGQQLLGIEDFGPFAGRSWIEMWEGADREAARAAVAAAAAGGNGGMVGQTCTLRGEAKWFDVALSPISDDNGTPVRLLAVSRDVTDRRREELDAQFMAEVSQDLAGLSTVGDIMQTVGAKLGAHMGLSLCNFVGVNEAADEAVVTYAWHRPDVPSSIGRYRLSEYLSDDFQATLRAGHSFVVHDTSTDPRTDPAAFAALKMGAFVCTPLVRDGRWRFMVNIHHTEPHTWHAAEIELMRELTTRMWTRLERVRIEQELHESEARFRTMADAITQLAWIARADGHIFWYNQRWYDYTGTTLEAMEGWGWQSVHDPVELPRVLEHYKASIATGEPFDLTFPLRGADGIFRAFLTRMIPLKDEAGRVQQWFGTNTDVSELKRVEVALADRVAELAQADRSKDEFLAMLAHELRNPLAPMGNAVQLLQMPDATADEREKAQQILERQIENMGRMINDLLDVSRITEGKIELQKKPVTLEAILTASTSLVRSTCAAHGQKVELSLPPEPVYLEADATRLEQVFGNLLTNACKYSGDGTHISISAQRAPAGEPSEVVVSVKDDGIGIAPELLPHVFGLFVQSTRSLDRAHGGLGIGLTLVQRLVKLHGGRVEAHSAGLGHGAEFIVHLPIVEKPPPPPETIMPNSREAPRRILIVDDNTDSALSLAALQRRRGHETCTAFTGPDALTAAVEFKPEVILLDIGLPGMDGFEVARQLRAMPASAKAMIIAMSGYGSSEDRRIAKEAGFDEYLVKPVELHVLRDHLRRMS